jgi:hypothetical protein
VSLVAGGRLWCWSGVVVYESKIKIEGRHWFEEDLKNGICVFH